MKNEIEKNWDEMSKAYEDFTEDEDSYSYTIEWPCIKRMLPSLHAFIETPSYLIIRFSK